MLLDSWRCRKSTTPSGDRRHHDPSFSQPPPIAMYNTRGIEAIATVTELRSRTSALIDQASKLETGIMIQKNNEPVAVLVDYKKYMKLYELEQKTSGKK